LGLGTEKFSEPLFRAPFTVWLKVGNNVLTSFSDSLLEQILAEKRCYFASHFSALFPCGASERENDAQRKCSGTRISILGTCSQGPPAPCQGFCYKSQHMGTLDSRLTYTAKEEQLRPSTDTGDAPLTLCCLHCRMSERTALTARPKTHASRLLRARAPPV